MELDTLLLSRLQFAFTISFHILFPTFTIGMASFLALLEGLYLKTGNHIYKDTYKFWAKIFALTFGMGVVSGVVLSYEFGTNFSRFAEAAGPVIGPLLTFEVMTAFFLEAGFLGVMLFGWDRVGPRLHFISTLMVAIGTTISTFWILSANSWMHTPQGAEFINGQFVPVDWWAIIFNPSFPYRLAHMLLASYLSAAFAIAGISAYHILIGRFVDFGKRSLKAALFMAMFAAPLQILVGDLHGLNVLHHQPMKVAAMEGRWDTMRGAPLLLFALPDQAAEKNHFEIGIPYGASLILKHSLDGEVLGLKEVAAADRPPMAPVFFAFRIMVGIGTLMLLLAWSGAWLWWQDRLTKSPRYLRALLLFSPMGFVATLAGWYVAEIGRQPWLVHGLMRTAEGVSPTLTAASVMFSLTLFVLVYGVLFAAYLYFLFAIARKGPTPTTMADVFAAHAPARPAFLTATR